MPAMKAAPQPPAGYWNDVERHVGPAVVDRFWMSHPLVRARINCRVSGDPALWPTQWFRGRFADRLPLRRALSLGCGTGNLERDLVRQGIVDHVTGVDLARAPLEMARSTAASEGLGTVITYLEADAREVLREAEGLDAVFFHGALHHFDRLPELLGLVLRALRPDGLLYLDEYVGPSMHEWGPRLLLLPNLFYYLLPRALRRPRLVRAPVNPEDPTESVCAAEIPRAVEGHFRILERRDYGGELLALIYPNLRQPGEGKAAPTPAQLDRAVRFLLDGEELLARHPAITGWRSHHAVIVAEPLPLTATQPD